MSLEQRLSCASFPLHGEHAQPAGPFIPRCELTVLGTPVPMQRARKGSQGRWYTPAKSIEYRERIQAAWMAAGRVSFGAQPVSIAVEIHVARPPTHLKKDGSIRPAYLEQLPPGDCDNYAKAIADALNELAYVDDKQIVCWAAISKCWAADGRSRSEIRIWPAQSFGRQPLQGLDAACRVPTTPS